MVICKQTNIRREKLRSSLSKLTMILNIVKKIATNCMYHDHIFSFTGQWNKKQIELKIRRSKWT